MNNKFLVFLVFMITAYKKIEVYLNMGDTIHLTKIKCIQQKSAIILMIK